MIISDLQFIENISNEANEIEGGRGRKRRRYFDYLPNKATAYAGAYAYGYGTYTDAYAYTKTNSYSSKSYAGAKSVSI